MLASAEGSAAWRRNEDALGHPPAEMEAPPPPPPPLLVEPRPPITATPAENVTPLEGLAVARPPAAAAKALPLQLPPPLSRPPPPPTPAWAAVVGLAAESIAVWSVVLFAIELVIVIAETEYVCARDRPL